MKSLDEKKLLARMSRNVGQPDLALEESIRVEEELNRKLFARPIPILVEKAEPVPIPLVEVVPPSPQPPKAFEPIGTIPKVPMDMMRSELQGMRKQLSDVANRVNTLSFGGGGTGVVRFYDLDDHQQIIDMITTPSNVDHISFDITGPFVDPPDGSISWNPDEECLDVHQPDGTTLQVGLEQYTRVHNDTGTVLQPGELVMFVGVEEPYPGVIEHTPTVDRFVANAAYPPIFIVGVMTEAVANAQNGRATTIGKVRDIDTTGTPVGETWAIGDLLWAHPTSPGKLTKVQPTAPNIVVSIAAVLHVSNTAGEILVRPTIYPQLHTGTFYSTVAQTAAVANTAYPVTWNADGLQCPHVNRANTSEVVCSHQGYYSFEFRLHLEAPKNVSGRVWIWARVDGVDVPNSTTELSLQGSGNVEARMYPSWSFVQTISAGGRFQLMWATDNTQISIHQPVATSFAPAARPAAIRVTQVNL
jgi:hypothetical protein